MKRKLRFILQYLTKKRVKKGDFDLGGNVKLFYWKMSETTENLGDYLSKVVVSHFMPKGVKAKGRKKTLYAIGSVIGFRCQDAVVWGSGILSAHPVHKNNIRYSSLDIRAVRGPKTRDLLMKWTKGISCPEVYGDPAILMPKIYQPNIQEKRYKISVVFHYEHNKFEIPEGEDIHFIDIQTTDYKKFIDEITQSSLVISSSLHGIILAEAYGVPAIALLKKEAIVFKFEDYYEGTGRKNMVVARTIQEAMNLTPMELPDLSTMQEQLLKAFPNDLWIKE